LSDILLELNDLPLQSIVLLPQGFKIVAQLSAFLLENVVESFQLLGKSVGLTFVLRNNSFTVLPDFSYQILVFSFQVGNA
jgi:hypothetical protein